MSSLKALLRRCAAVAPVAGLAIALGCQGPDQFLRYSDTNQTGVAGSSATGTAGSTGSGGTNAGGTGGGPLGVGGSNGGTAGASGGSVGGTSTGTGGSATGTGGTSLPAGSGGGAGTSAGSAGSSAGRGGGAGGSTTGTGGSTGTAGATGVGGRAGTTGTGGSATGTGGSTTGTGGSTGGSATGTGGTATGTGGTATGTGGSATGTGGSAAGATGTGGGAGSGTVDRIEVVAKCQPADGAQDIRVTFKILNPGSVTKQWSDIKVRYYFTPTAALPAMAKFDFTQKIPASMLTTNVTDTYVEVGFATGTGTVAAFDNVTGSDEIQLHLYNYSTPTWNTSETDDYSFAACASGANTSAYTDRTTMPGYYQGQLAWGTEPAY